jgi:HAD superfamily hydrolase (TIGR01484 family)
MFPYLFSDFDGTLTSNGKIGPGFFRFVDLLHTKQMELVIVSGRSIAWGHFFLTHFPFKSVVMENGGVVLQKKRNHIQNKVNPSKSEIDHLKKVTSALLKKFPKLELSHDSCFRQSDRAIPLRQLDPVTTRDIQNFFDQEGVKHTCSNVHLNYWVGDFDKLSGIKLWSEEVGPIDFKKITEEAIFIGDGLNDESVFKGFKRSFGVKNIEHNQSKFKYLPHHISKYAEIEGALDIIKQFV